MAVATRARINGSDGNPIGQQNAQLFESSDPRDSVFLGRDSINNIVDHTWTGEASLVLTEGHQDLILNAFDPKTDIAI